MVRCDLNPEQLKDERFEELCALAPLGELSASEFAELNEHLPGCDNCRALYADFRRIASSDLGAVAAGQRYGDDAVGDLDEPALLKRLLERAQLETNVHGTRPVTNAKPERQPSSLKAAWWRVAQGPIPAAALLVLLCAAAAIGGYQFNGRRISVLVTQPTAPLSAPPPHAAELTAERRSTSEKLQQREEELRVLQRSVAEARRKYAELSQRQTTLEMELTATKQQLQQKQQELQAAGAETHQSDQLARELQGKLREAVMRTQEQERTVNQLGARLG